MDHPHTFARAPRPLRAALAGTTAMALAAVLGPGAAPAAAVELGPLTKVSDGDPFAACTADKAGQQDGTFAINPARIKQNVIDLTRDFMTMQATGDYQAARQMVEKLAVVRPQVQTILDRLKGVPVDIEPRFATASELLAEGK